MDEHRGLSGCQVVGIAVAILLVAIVCMGTGLVLGGGIGLITGGTAGYAIGRAQSTRIEPHIEVPMPPSPGDEEWEPPEEPPEMEMRPCLGVHYETVEEGARIIAVEPGRPADRAGLREGDVILAVDGKLVGEGRPNLAARILDHEPGDEVELRVQRGDVELELEATLGMRLGFESPCLPAGELPGPLGRPHLGVRIRQLERGAKVTEVAPGSPADEASLLAGDLILAVDDEKVTRETPLVALIAAHKAGDTVILTIEREGRERESEVELGEWPAPEEPGTSGEG